MPFTPPTYTPFTWQDFEAGGTALSAAELMDAQLVLSQGFQAGDNAVAAYTDLSVATCAPKAKRVNYIASSSTPAINVANTDVFVITGQAVPITSMSTGLTGVPTPEQGMMIRIHAATALGIVWGPAFIGSGSVQLPLSTSAGKTIRVGVVWDEVVSKWVSLAADPAGY